MEKLKHMKHKLTEAVEKEISGNLEYTNAEELGEAVDMIKDLSEAIYYCTITEAMEGKDQEKKGNHYPSAHYYGETKNRVYPFDANYQYPVMYNDGNPSYYPPIMYAQDGARQTPGESRYYSPMYYQQDYTYPPMGVDYDGRSYMVRRRYMDGKRYNDKQTQIQELERYTQELASDLTDMIKDASPEEKAVLQQKIQLLATKIK